MPFLLENSSYKSHISPISYVQFSTLRSTWVTAISDFLVTRLCLRTEFKKSLYRQCQPLFVKIGKWFENYYTGRKNGKKDNVQIPSNIRRHKLKDKVTLLKKEVCRQCLTQRYMLHELNTVTSTNDVKF